MFRKSPATPAQATLPIDAALGRNETLSGLMRRVQDSNARYATARSVLPPGLASLVRPGPLDDTSWALLVPNGAAAAKLRQCLPTVVQSLKASGWAEVSIRIKVIAAAPEASR